MNVFHVGVFYSKWAFPYNSSRQQAAMNSYQNVTVLTIRCVPFFESAKRLEYGLLFITKYLIRLEYLALLQKVKQVRN